jgi:predicted DNA-binding transcriptional regulator YafY
MTPWTRETLRLIRARPGVRAADLARDLGHAHDEFKRDVRKLKNLGLTISLETGYRLTPKGEALLTRG